jgi:hypothetical protein
MMIYMVEEQHETIKISTLAMAWTLKGTMSEDF